ncbi:16S rRNA (cytidine(1402)-2'-O)-methyltransferase [Candidatus Latescibacterota bacterium]
MADSPGTLYIVATPIGNMEDLSPRAASSLRSAQVIACEDTRRTGLLCSRLGFKNRYLSYNDLNARKRIPLLLKILADGGDVALVSDAGTPGISDPAYRIVTAAVAGGYPVVCIPGPTAAICALVVSGFPLDRFVFEGFLPPKGASRVRRLSSLAGEPRTIVLYESPHRIVKLLGLIREHLGDRDVSVSREMTKLHEETLRGPVSQVLEQIGGKRTRGEYTVVIRGASKEISP